MSRSSTTTPRPSAAIASMASRSWWLRPGWMPSTSSSGFIACIRTRTGAGSARSPFESTMCSPPPAVSVNTRICQAPPCSETTVETAVSRTRLSWRRRWAIRSEMVPIFSAWRWAKATRSGRRAMLPSSFMISQITPAGLRPASRAMSTAASVWPARTSTPPSRARKREDVAGRGDVLGARARVDGDGDGAGAVVGGDAGGHALARLDRDGEGGLVARWSSPAPSAAGRGRRAARRGARGRSGRGRGWP